VGNGVGLDGCDPVLDGMSAWWADYTTQGGSDIAVGCLTDTGSVDWATFAGSTGDDLGTAVAASELGSLFVAGTFGGDITFDADGPNETDLTIEGDETSTLFVAKYGL
jgi:hypothetical protein